MDVGSMKKCPVCKKEFYVPCLSLWTYTVKKRDNVKVPYCSWSCFRSLEKKKEVRHCINCGKEIIGKGKIYCDYFCKIDFEQLRKDEKKATKAGVVLT